MDSYDDQVCKKELELSIERKNEVLHTLGEELASVNKKLNWLETNDDWVDHCCNLLKEKIKFMEESIKILSANTESLDPDFIKSLKPAESASELLEGLATKFIELPLNEFLQQVSVDELEALPKSKHSKL